MSVNDRLFDELLRPIVDAFYETAQSLAALPQDDPTQIERAIMLTRPATLEEVGDLIAGVIDVAPPLWHDMRCLADPTFNEVAG